MPESVNTTPFPHQSVLCVPSHNSWRNDFCFWMAIHDSLFRHRFFFLAKLSFHKSEKVDFTDIQTFTHIYFKWLFSRNYIYLWKKNALRDHRLHALHPWIEKLWLNTWYSTHMSLCVTMDLHGQWIVVLFGWNLWNYRFATPRTAATMIVMMIEMMMLIIAYRS